MDTNPILTDSLLNKETIRGWGGRCSHETKVVRPTTLVQIKQIIGFAKSNNKTIIVKGGGYSYGDIFLGADITIDTSNFNKILSWDKSSGIIRTQSGATIKQILECSAKDSWYLAACPGWPGITIGGAISTNTHGKDSFSYGNIGNAVKSLKLLTNDDNEIAITKNDDPDLLKLVVGSLGLTGAITEVELALIPMPSKILKTSAQPAKHLREFLALFDENIGNNDFVYGWMDMFSSGPSLGRGVIFAAKWDKSSKDRKDLSSQHSNAVLDRTFFQRCLSEVTACILKVLLTKYFISVTNTMIYFFYKLAALRKHTKTIDYKTFFFPHSRVAKFNEIFKPDGFFEFQICFPQANAFNAFVELFELCNKHNTNSYVAGIKKHQLDDYPLSFSENGYSISITLPARYFSNSQVESFTNHLSDLMANHQGTFYIAKDESFGHKQFSDVYGTQSTLAQFRNDKNIVQLFQSCAIKRLISKDKLVNS